ncbi:DUF2778 domain-containing protein [Paraburkholderia sp. D15]|uniref:DUF2778 domain-containing protein n=1 Tax=Paraburkholderia sp. D15 TaxID=2880218 RepID=UPI0024799EDE|nr:DUF2778 domain-containing protein [Paraburkholderia sp. D15]WGS50647.1 DUF2778 domain-containing protein [Paraburkholderia sp. D15]
MPITCTFTLNNRSMSMLVCPGIGGMPAFSGLGRAVNDPGEVARADIGPLPPGTYFIIDRQSGGRLGWFWDNMPGHNPKEWFALYRDDGIIDDETFVSGVRRGNFRLHPRGSMGISKGCITLARKEDFEKLRTILHNQQPFFVGAGIKAYGRIEVSQP